MSDGRGTPARWVPGGMTMEASEKESRLRWVFLSLMALGAVVTLTLFKGLATG